METIKTSKRKSRWALGLLPVLTAGLLSATVAPAFAHTWNDGDVFAAVSDGQYFQYNFASTTKTDTLQPGVLGGSTTPPGGFTAGCAINPRGPNNASRNLYTTVWHERKVVVLPNGAATHLPPISIDTTRGIQGRTGRPENIVFNSTGDFYVGMVDAAPAGPSNTPPAEPNLLKFNKDHQFVQEYTLPTGVRGVDAMDLSSDQTTLFYTSEDRIVRRYSLAGTGSALADFLTLPAGHRAYGLRILQGGNPFGGHNPDEDPLDPDDDFLPGFLMVADFESTPTEVLSSNIKVFGNDTNGPPALMNTFDVPGLDGWFSISIDAGGEQFVATEFYGGNVVTFAPHPSGVGGTVIRSFQADPRPFRVNGVCVMGELTVGVIPFPQKGFFVVGDVSADYQNGYPNGTQVYFWGSQWQTGTPPTNQLSGTNTGDGSFKGFAEKATPSTPKCGSSFSSKGGQPKTGDLPATVPARVAIIVTESLSDPPGGDKVFGLVKAIILVEVDPGYGPSPGNPGTGKIVEVLCKQP